MYRQPSVPNEQIPERILLFNGSFLVKCSQPFYREFTPQEKEKNSFCVENASHSLGRRITLEYQKPISELHLEYLTDLQKGCYCAILSDSAFEEDTILLVSYTGQGSLCQPLPLRFLSQLLNGRQQKPGKKMMYFLP